MQSFGTGGLRRVKGGFMRPDESARSTKTRSSYCRASSYRSSALEISFSRQPTRQACILADIGLYRRPTRKSLHGVFLCIDNLTHTSPDRAHSPDVPGRDYYKPVSNVVLPSPRRHVARPRRSRHRADVRSRRNSPKRRLIRRHRILTL